MFFFSSRDHFILVYDLQHWDRFDASCFFVQIGTAVFDPLHESGTESVYLGMGDNGSWHSTTTTTATTPTTTTPPPTTTTATSTNVGGAELHDPVADLKQLSSLWKTWSSLVEEGANV